MQIVNVLDHPWSVNYGPDRILSKTLSPQQVTNEVPLSFIHDEQLQKDLNSKKIQIRFNAKDKAFLQQMLKMAEEPIRKPVPPPPKPKVVLPPAKAIVSKPKPPTGQPVFDPPSTNHVNVVTIGGDDVDLDTLMAQNKFAAAPKWGNQRSAIPVHQSQSGGIFGSKLHGTK